MKFTFRIELPSGIYTEVGELWMLNSYLADIAYHGRCRLEEVKITIVKCEVIDLKTIKTIQSIS